MYRKDTGSKDLFNLPEYTNKVALELLIPKGYHIQEGQGYIDIFEDYGPGSSYPVVSYTNQ